MRGAVPGNLTKATMFWLVRRMLRNNAPQDPDQDDYLPEQQRTWRHLIGVKTARNKTKNNQRLPLIGTNF